MGALEPLQVPAVTPPSIAKLCAAGQPFLPLLIPFQLMPLLILWPLQPPRPRPFSVLWRRFLAHTPEFLICL